MATLKRIGFYALYGVASAVRVFSYVVAKIDAYAVKLQAYAQFKLHPPVA